VDRNECEDRDGGEYNKQSLGWKPLAASGRQAEYAAYPTKEGSAIATAYNRPSPRRSQFRSQDPLDRIQNARAKPSTRGVAIRAGQCSGKCTKQRADERKE
jgi:hypothetical protein